MFIEVTKEGAEEQALVNIGQIVSVTQTEDGCVIKTSDGENFVSPMPLHELSREMSRASRGAMRPVR